MAITIGSKDWRQLDLGLDVPWRRWIMSFLILALTSVLVVLLKPVLDGEVSSGLLFMLGIALVGATAGLMPALICAIIASAYFNFFLAKPVLTFRMSTGEDLAPPVIFTLCAIVSGILSGRLKDESSHAKSSNLRLESLLETSRSLQCATSEIEVYKALRSVLSDRLGIELSLYRASDEGVFAIGDSRTEPRWLRLAHSVSANRTDYVCDQGLTGYLLSGSQSSVGAIVSDQAEDETLHRNFMLALAQIAGLAMERAQFFARVAEAQAVARAEELKSALLSSVSHDLRTPLTAISTSASSLLAFGNRFDQTTSDQLLQGIVEECDRLNHFTANLLEMTRLQGGPDTIRRSVLSVAEIARKAIARQRRFAGNRDISFEAPQRELLVEVDIVLFELALANVLQNAMQYSPPDTEIAVACVEVADHCEISVTDKGIGIPREEQARVFDRFYRVQRGNGAPKGTGLGLAIAKGFVEASHGAIAIQSPAHGNGGTRVTIRLPLAKDMEIL